MGLKPATECAQRALWGHWYYLEWITGEISGQLDKQYSLIWKKQDNAAS